jgi:hypothetical protein
MPGIGGDQLRCGWYDVMERKLSDGQQFHRYAWHDRKAWWQQEQGILAYLILNGCLKKPEYRKLAQESSAFYNAWFLDNDSGAVYFNTLASGLPYLLGTERDKGSHSMGAYHSCELCYLAAVYTNLLITKQPMDFYFRPQPGGFKDNILRVSPDILPPGSIKIEQCWIDDVEYTNFDADELTPGSQMMLQSPAPVARAASTKSRWLTCVVAVVEVSDELEQAAAISPSASNAARRRVGLSFRFTQVSRLCGDKARQGALQPNHDAPDVWVKQW